MCLQLKLADGAGKIGLLQRQDIASSLEVRRVLESRDLFRLMRGLMHVGTSCLDRCSVVLSPQQRLPNMLGAAHCHHSLRACFGWLRQAKAIVAMLCLGDTANGNQCHAAGASSHHWLQMAPCGG